MWPWNVYQVLWVVVTNSRILTNGIRRRLSLEDVAAAAPLPWQPVVPTIINVSTALVVAVGGTATTTTTTTNHQTTQQQRNAASQRRVYHKRRLALLSLQEQVRVWQERNAVLQQENTRLEGLLNQARPFVLHAL